ncbi:MAG: hypothetical protein ACI9OJ_004461 [Myxococcota bacterium]
MNFARLNHILIPDTKDGRDRFRHSRFGRITRPLGVFYYGLTTEGRFLGVFWMLCGAAGLEVGSTQIYALWALVTGLLCASLLMRRAYRLDGCAVTVASPARVTVGETIHLTVTVANPDSTPIDAVGVVGPLLPWDGQYVGGVPAIPEVPAEGSAQCGVVARFSARGEHHLDPFHLARIVPPGLGLGPALETRGVRFLVVPEVANVVSVMVPGASRYQPGGGRAAASAPSATEFAGVRPYRAGDRVRDLHARLSGRAGFPVVREFREEYYPHVAIVLDCGFDRESRFELAVQLVAGVVARLSNSETLIDLVVGGTPAIRLPRGSGASEAGLDHLAMAAASPFDLVQIDQALQDPQHTLSAVVFVTTVFDEERRRLVAHLRERGLSVTPVLVGQQVLEPGVTLVTEAELASGGAILL